MTRDGERRRDRGPATVPSISMGRRPAPGRRTLTAGMTVQRRAEPPGTGKGRAGTAAPSQPATPDVPGGMAEAFASVTGSPGATLPFLDVIQPAFGDHDLSSVSSHTGDDARAASEQLGATAFATGNHVAFAGAPDLHTAAHEAAHIVQQRSGVHLKGGIGAAGDAYEREADAVADRVVAGESAAPLLERYTPSAGSPRRLDLVQRKPDLPTGQPSPPAGPYVEAAEDLDEDLAPDTDAPIQRQAPPRKRSYIPFQIAIRRDMTGDEFKAAANQQSSAWRPPLRVAEPQGRLHPRGQPRRHRRRGRAAPPRSRRHQRPGRHRHRGHRRRRRRRRPRR
jgi:hypothetical protein